MSELSGISSQLSAVRTEGLALIADGSLEALLVRSPAVEDGETKDQDRVLWLEKEQIACVCDGTTSSPYADEAAQFVVDYLECHHRAWLSADAHVFQSEVDGLVDGLLRLRHSAANRPIRVPEVLAAPVRLLLEQDVKEKRRYSHRTTMISARFGCGSDDMLYMRLFKCGDSELLVFRPDGKLLFTTAEVRWETTGGRSPVGAGEMSTAPTRLLCFHHPSSVTEVMPDKHIHAAAWAPEFRFPVDSCFLLTTDGLLDAFPGSTDLFTWLQTNYCTLADEEAGAVVMRDLHAQLKQRRGDDDISFIAISYQPSTISTTRSEL